MNMKHLIFFFFYWTWEHQTFDLSFAFVMFLINKEKSNVSSSLSLHIHFEIFLIFVSSALSYNQLITRNSSTPYYSSVLLSNYSRGQKRTINIINNIINKTVGMSYTDTKFQYHLLRYSIVKKFKILTIFIQTDLHSNYFKFNTYILLN